MTGRSLLEGLGCSLGGPSQQSLTVFCAVERKLQGGGTLRLGASTTGYATHG